MGGVAKGVTSALGMSDKGISGKNNYNINTALNYANPNLNTVYGSHTYDAGTNTHTYGQSENDAMRTNLISQMLGNIDQSVLYPKQYQDAYYNSAMGYLQPKMDRDLATMDEQLINRGIQTGNKQYNDTMGALRDDQNQQLNQLLNQALLGGIDAANKTTSGIGSFANQLQAGSDINTLMQMQNMNDASNLYAEMLGINRQNNMYNNQASQQNAAQGWNTMFSLGSGAFGLSDERLKENLRHVATLENGVKIYIGNYKKELGLDTAPRLFVIAQEVEKLIPEAVIIDKSGIKKVNYNLIDKGTKTWNN